MFGFGKMLSSSRRDGDFLQALKSVPRYKTVAEFVRSHPEIATGFMASLNKSFDERDMQDYKFTKDDMQKDFSKLELAEQMELLEYPKFQALYDVVDRFIAEADRRQEVA